MPLTLFGLFILISLDELRSLCYIEIYMCLCFVGPSSDVYSIEGQVQHKVEFLLECVPPDVPLILIGHSIGAYIILEIMSEIGADRILQSVLLFPTIERMAATPQGSRVTPLLRYFRWLVPLAALPLYYLTPMRFKSMLTSFMSRNQDVPGCAVKATLRLVTPSCASNILYMGLTEMRGAAHSPPRSVIAQYSSSRRPGDIRRRASCCCYIELEEIFL